MVYMAPVVRICSPIKLVPPACHFAVLQEVCWPGKISFHLYQERLSGLLIVLKCGIYRMSKYILLPFATHAHAGVQIDSW